ncbi:FHA domain-containing protein [Neofamilia massiliensis]|uniref:FHA domain-containing protein n=1 Tax=Neofamilia massiliensis TaxID=1673724 RepID=UPI0006BB70CB|nr:FHA domain-containing protein [Neofamilia massiliensis]
MFEILSLVLRYVFIVIIYLFILNIIRLIYLDIRSSVSMTPKTDVAYLKVINRLDQLDFKMQEYYPIVGEITVGRGSRNDVFIKDRVVSKSHMKIFLADGYYYLEDLGSANGTFLNGNDIENNVVEIVDGDLISVGKVQFMFVNR